MDLVNFFISFDKLMKEKLVRAFFWLGLILIVLTFFAKFLAAIHLGPLAWILDSFKFVVRLLFAIVGLRLLCEAAIALFRINDNLSPDGGKSETADIDPLQEALRAAEDAVKKAQEATSNVVSRTRSAAGSAADKAEDVVDDVEDSVEEAVEAVKETVKKKRATTKKSTSSKTSTSDVKLNKDGTPRKKPGPKSKPKS